ncbi:MAG: hypothetical protein ACJ8F7_03600, partial [Gemmataceae bacterium]
ALGDRSFAARDKARQELEHYGELVAPALRDAAGNAPSADARQLAKRLLDRLAHVSPPADQLRLLRAIEALEMAGTPEAAQVLKQLAEGAPESAVTAAAEIAGRRLAARKN